VHRFQAKEQVKEWAIFFSSLKQDFIYDLGKRCQHYREQQVKIFFGTILFI
jgi:hypothetical protein